MKQPLPTEGLFLHQSGTIKSLPNGDHLV